MRLLAQLQSEVLRAGAIAAAPGHVVTLETTQASLTQLQETMLRMETTNQAALQAQLMQSQREAAFGIQVDDPPTVGDLPQLDVKTTELMATYAMMRSVLNRTRGKSI